MPANDYQIDLRDIRFVLFEQLPFSKLQAIPRYAGLDRDEVDLLLDECFRFNRDVLAPLNRPGDREGCTYRDGQVFVPRGFKEAYRAFCENGWLGVTASEEHGGMGLPAVVGAATAEMNIAANCSLALSIGLTHAAAQMIEAFGTDEMKRIYLPRLLSGEWQGTMCLTEPQAGSAVGDITSLARPDGDSWLLSGTKSFITAGDHDLCTNHVHLVLARTPDAPKGFKGISIFLVPKYRPAPDGGAGEFNDVVCAGIEHKMGIKASPTCTLHFGENGLCRAWLIGEIGQGLPIMFHMMNEARIGVGIQGMSLASLAYLYAAAYAAERIQGVDIEEMKNLDAPRVFIREHPDVRRMLLWCKAVVEGSRSLLYSTAFFADLARHFPDEAERARYQGWVEFLTPVCKAYVSDRAFEVTTWALQVLGGYGYSSDYPVEQCLRDVKISSIYEGTNGIQALDLLGRKLAARGGALFLSILEELNRFASSHKEHLVLGDLVSALSAEVARWQETTMKLGAMGMAGDRRYPVLCATPYLEMTGHLMTAWMLVAQAILAHDRLQGVYLDRNALGPAARTQLCREDLEARFYFNKIETARFFIHHLLPRNRAIAAEIESGDRSPLSYVP
jgi:alkylation response protein AidB-like acyl-CoA dehydrogenase